MGVHGDCYSPADSGFPVFRDWQETGLPFWGVVFHHKESKLAGGGKCEFLYGQAPCAGGGRNRKNITECRFEFLSGGTAAAYPVFCIAVYCRVPAKEMQDGAAYKGIMLSAVDTVDGHSVCEHYIPHSAYGFRKPCHTAL